MTFRKRPQASVFDGLVFGGVGRLLLFAVQFVTAPLIARLLGPYDYGLLALVTSAMGLVVLVSSLALDAQAARDVTTNLHRDMVSWAVTSGLFFMLLVLSLAQLIDSEIRRVIVWYSPILVAGPVLAVIHGVLSAHDEARATVTMRIVPGIARLIAVLALLIVAVDASAEGIAALESIVGLVTVALGAYLGRRWIRGPKPPQLERLFFFARNGLPIVVVSASWLVIQRSDLLIVGWLLGEETAGRYQAALRLSEVPLEMLSGMLLMYLPSASRVTDGMNLRSLHHQTTTALAVFLVPITVGIAVWGSPIIALLFGEEFVVSNSIMVLLLLGVGTHILTGPVGTTLVARQQNATLMWAASTAIVVNIVADLALIPFLGLRGAAIASSSGFVIVNVWHARSVRRYLGKVLLIGRQRYAVLWVLVVSIVVNATIRFATSVPVALGVILAGAATIGLSALSAEVRSQIVTVVMRLRGSALKTTL